MAALPIIPSRALSLRQFFAQSYPHILTASATQREPSDHVVNGMSDRQLANEWRRKQELKKKELQRGKPIPLTSF